MTVVAALRRRYLAWLALVVIVATVLISRGSGSVGNLQLQSTVPNTSRESQLTHDGTSPSTVVATMPCGPHATSGPPTEWEKQWDGAVAREVLELDGGDLLVGFSTRVDAMFMVLSANGEPRCAWKMGVIGATVTGIGDMTRDGDVIRVRMWTDGGFSLGGTTIDALPQPTRPPRLYIGEPRTWNHTEAIVTLDPATGPIAVTQIAVGAPNRVALGDGGAVYVDGTDLVNTSADGTTRWRTEIGNMSLRDGIDVLDDGTVLLRSSNVSLPHVKDHSMLGFRRIDAAGRMLEACGYHERPGSNRVLAVVDGLAIATDTVSGPPFTFRCRDGEPLEYRELLEGRGVLLGVHVEGDEIRVIYRAEEGAEAPLGSGVYAARLDGKLVEPEILGLEPEHYFTRIHDRVWFLQSGGVLMATVCSNAGPCLVREEPNW